MSTFNTLLIGSGRLARHLQYWSNLNQPLADTLNTWNRSESVETLHRLILKADLVWLAISDKAIIPFYEEYLKTSKAKVVHFSGAIYDERIIGVHPLMSFPNELLENPVYEKIYFAIDRSGLDLKNILPGFGNQTFFLSAEQKALYHALCVSAGNFPQLLWSLCLKEFRALKVPDQAIELYVQQIANLFAAHKENSLTGPLVRNDLETIEKNILAIQKNQALTEIYKTFAGVYKNEN